MTIHASRPIVPDTSTPGHLSQGPGGVATNVARALKKLDVPAHIIGAIGDDPAGESLAALFHQEGIHAHLTRCEGATTGHYFALHDPDGSLPAACIDDRLLAAVAPETFSQGLTRAEAEGLADICFLDANLSTEQARTLISAVSNETLVAADAVSSAKALHLRPLLAEIDLLFLNRDEAIALSGSRADAPAPDVLAELQSAGAHTLFLTEGQKGLWLAEPGAAPRHFQAPPVAVTDVTGAGDALIAGVLSALARGLPLSDAAPFGLAAAALTLQAKGAVPDSLSWPALSPARPTT